MAICKTSDDFSERKVERAIGSFSKRWMSTALLPARIGELDEYVQAPERLLALENLPELHSVRDHEFPYRAIAVAVVDLRGGSALLRSNLRSS